MLKRLVVVAAALCAVAAAAETATVVVRGHTYATGLIPSKEQNPERVLLEHTDLPATYNAVDAGKATPVKGDGQGSCGDCWAWARTSSLEAAVLAAGHPLLHLSEEDTTDNSPDDYGCGGGMMHFTYELEHGVALEADCPFSGGGGSCSAAVAAKGVKMAYVGGSDGPTDDELRQAIYVYGSVAVTVAAGGNFDVDSGSDRMTSCGARGVNHMVSLVGYRPSPNGGVEFLMKNSWGSGWGAKGYAWMKRGCNEIATGDQSAMVISIDDGPVPPPPPPPPPVTWECKAKGRRGTYSARDAVKSTAAAAAMKQCKDADRRCRAAGCQKL